MKEKKIVVTDDARFVDSYITYTISKLKFTCNIFNVVNCKHINITYDDPKPIDILYFFANISRIKNYGYKSKKSQLISVDETLDRFSGDAS